MKNELEKIAREMNDAGYKGITADMVKKVSNKRKGIYVAVDGDVMLVYTPGVGYYYNSGFQIVLI